MNRLLTAVYNRETRLSSLLADLGFSPQQIETIRREHLEYVTTQYIALIEERLLQVRAGGERLSHIINRRFGLDGNPPETSQALGQRLGISRERIRQLEQKTLKRCRAVSNRRFREAGLRDIAAALVGEAGGSMPSSTVMGYPGQQHAPLGEATQEIVEQPDEENHSGLEDVPEVAELIAAILQTVPDGLSCGMLTHVLAGSSGPVVTAVVEHYGLPQHGVLKLLGHSKVKEITREVCSTNPHFAVAQGRVKLKRPPNRP